MRFTTPRSRAVAVLALPLPALLLTPPAAAQGLNVDCGATSQPAPPDTYAAAAGQAGFWNEVETTVQLRDLNGNVLPVFLQTPAHGNFTGDAACTMGDDQALLDDFHDPNAAGTYRFSGLQPGNYRVFTYAIATDDPTFRTDVSVQGSPDPLQTVGGDFCNGHVQGESYALHSVTVTNGLLFVDVTLNTGFATVNGFQIVCDTCTVGTPICFGDGSGTPCPCGNPGGADAGCANGSGSGATLGASGTPSAAADSIVLEAGNAIPGQPGLFFQGDNATNGGNGLVFGDGLRCCGANVIRLEVVVPGAGGAAVTSVPVGATGGVSAGDTRCYQYWYRDPAGSPCGSSFNLTNGYELTWQ